MSFPESALRSDDPRPVLSVSDLTGQIKDCVEGNFPDVWVAGEISNLSRPQSGHCYLTLKDERAQIRAVMWRATAARCRFELEDGLEVVCQGELEVYAPRGSYQLVIRQIEPRGMGALELALRRLREKLAAEGLFDPARKRPLPRFPRRIAFVTSPTGAAIRDFLQVLRRRWLGADVLIVPTRVQGDGAGNEIAAAIAAANRLSMPIDCLVVGRGGGSLEDLWAFNEEVVVRAICASRIPVVSAVGHEIDVTLSDLAADVRALTPSEAAELVVPASEELAAALIATRSRMLKGLRGRWAALRARLDTFADRRAFRRPLELVHERSQRLDELGGRAIKAIARRLDVARQRVVSDAARLDSLSPLAVLGRGYSLTHRADTGAVVRDTATLHPGDELVTRFAAGRATSKVVQVEPPQAPGTSDRFRT
ncbi:MAG TPA: exodeoxyribonuclease VII large subunit [Pirellulales bacterium]|jgi:exodeoxyribonuclease VII large subunit|nr:exodeoxyribonuclease VII large subunit [Pirellulales bacterium]